MLESGRVETGSRRYAEDGEATTLDKAVRKHRSCFIWKGSSVYHGRDAYRNLRLCVGSCRTVVPCKAINVRAWNGRSRTAPPVRHRNRIPGLNAPWYILRFGGKAYGVPELAKVPAENADAGTGPSCRLVQTPGLRVEKYPLEQSPNQLE
jgi:hypothetical protein